MCVCSYYYLQYDDGNYLQYDDGNDSYIPIQVLGRFCAADILHPHRSLVGAPPGVPVYALDGSVILKPDQVARGDIYCMLSAEWRTDWLTYIRTYLQEVGTTTLWVQEQKNRKVIRSHTHIHTTYPPTYRIGDTVRYVRYLGRAICSCCLYVCHHHHYHPKAYLPTHPIYTHTIGQSYV